MGGLGEVGRNMTAFELNGKILIVDCGVLFPELTQPGVDLILPDWTPIADRLDDVVAVVLTHGHEDHIGAVPFLLKQRPDIPLLGSKLTLALVEAKLAEHHITPYTLTVKEGVIEQVGEFELEFVAVNHSVPDALAVEIRTVAGNVLDTGDFKMDQLPIDGRLTDLRAFGRLGEDGVDLFMSDSTNAHIPGFTASERNIGPVLKDAIGKAHQRVIVSTFSSHVHRVQQIVDAAVAAHRKVVLVGRSMVRNIGLAADLGYLHVPDGVLVDLHQIGDIPDNKLVYICTGSQGESLAALSRIADGSHRQIRLDRGDLVIFASSLIPGNENSVYGLMNKLIHLGAHVISKADAMVHVSGHACAGELLYCFNIIKPRNVMPIHGEFRHLTAAAELAIQTGVPRKHAFVVEGGSVVDMHKGQVRVVGQYPCEHVYVDGSSIGEITEDDLQERLTLSSEGFISAVIGVDLSTGRVVLGPTLQARGFAEDDSVLEAVKPKILEAVQAAVDDGRASQQGISQAVRRAVGRWVSQKYRRSPLILPVVMPADHLVSDEDAAHAAAPHA
ncbi:MAG: ribonuclease J [Microbacteriaceae bacterium]|jgi:ribonuclease J|nr:ribonuclease J [Microbacteriaceae bacterium]MCI1207043.1 ribonuclease J [Microbacteriaceae bacterium]